MKRALKWISLLLATVLLGLLAISWQSDLDPADGVTYEVVYNAADLTVLVVPG